MVQRWTLCLMVCSAITLFASSAAAQNMVVNGDFDTDVLGWTTFGTPFDWNSADWLGAPVSGSGLLTNEVDGTMHAGIVACVDGVVGGQSYDLGGMIMIPSGQAGSGGAGYGLYWREGAGCSGSQSVGGYSPYIVESDVWVHLTLWGLVAPAGTQSAEVMLLNNKTSAGTDPYLSYHDGVYFGLFGGVFADGFETGSTYEWSATAP